MDDVNIVIKKLAPKLRKTQNIQIWKVGDEIN